MLKTQETQPATSVPTQAQYSVFVQPGCSSCLRTKEFLAQHGIPFRVVDVANDPGGMVELQSLGVRHIPIVALGSEYAYGQDIDDVARFVGVDLPRLRRLSPEVLVQRYDAVLAAAQSSVSQLPDDVLGEHPIPNRPGTIRGLGYHIFRIVQSFLDAVGGSEPDWIVNSMQSPPSSLRTGKDIAAYGDLMRESLGRWWNARTTPITSDTVRTFQGEQSLHWFLERSAWHSAQHARQIEEVLARLGIQPHHMLSREVLDGLPVPERIWQ
jgi:glutaredoxin